MVDAISGSGLDRVVSSQQQFVDRTEELQRARAAAASRQATNDAFASAGAAQLKAERQAASQEALTGRPRLGDLIRDPQTANHILEQTQSVDLANAADQTRKAEQAVQAQRANYALRNYFLSFVNPGGDFNVLAMRTSYKMPDEGP